MKDYAVIKKEEKLVEMLSSFCDEMFNEEYKILAVNMDRKLGRKGEVPFKRGKLENWASGIMYTIAQINFLFDKSSVNYIGEESICNYFGIMKSTASNKSYDVRKLFNLKKIDEEFVLNEIKESGILLGNSIF